MKVRPITYAFFILTGLFAFLMSTRMVHAQNNSYKLILDVLSQAGSNTGSSDNYKIQDCVGQPSPPGGSAFDPNNTVILSSGFQVQQTRNSQGRTVFDADVAHNNNQNLGSLKSIKAEDSINIAVYADHCTPDYLTKYVVRLVYDPVAMSYQDGQPNFGSEPNYFGDNMSFLSQKTDTGTVEISGEVLAQEKSPSDTSGLLGVVTFVASDRFPNADENSFSDVSTDIKLVEVVWVGPFPFEQDAISEEESLKLESCPVSDFNGDHYVDFWDFLEFVDAYDSACGDANYDQRYDIYPAKSTGDCKIDFQDFLIFAPEFGIRCLIQN